MKLDWILIYKNLKFILERWFALITLEITITSNIRPSQNFNQIAIWICVSGKIILGE